MSNTDHFPFRAGTGEQAWSESEATAASQAFDVRSDVGSGAATVKDHEDAFLVADHRADRHADVARTRIGVSADLLAV